MLNYLFNYRYTVVPFVGSTYIYRDDFTRSLWEAEDVPGPEGREWLLYCGTWRIYLTPRHKRRSQRP